MALAVAQKNLVGRVLEGMLVRSNLQMDMDTATIYCPEAQHWVNAVISVEREKEHHEILGVVQCKRAIINQASQDIRHLCEKTSL